MVQCYTENLHFLIDHIPLHQIGRVNTETVSAVPLFLLLPVGVRLLASASLARSEGRSVDQEGKY